MTKRRITTHQPPQEQGGGGILPPPFRSDEHHHHHHRHLTRKNTVIGKRLIIFDLVWTLVKPTEEGQRVRSEEHGWEVLPGRASRLKVLQEQGVYTALASNQGRTALGELERETIERDITKLADELGIGYVSVCYDHPARTQDPVALFRRKPAPGMLLECMEHYQVGMQETLYVGDRDDDRVAAERAGVTFQWAEDFFGESRSTPWTREDEEIREGKESGPPYA